MDSSKIITEDEHESDYHRIEQEVKKFAVRPKRRIFSNVSNLQPYIGSGDENQLSPSNIHIIEKKMSFESEKNNQNEEEIVLKIRKLSVSDVGKNLI